MSVSSVGHSVGLGSFHFSKVSSYLSPYLHLSSWHLSNSAENNYCNLRGLQTNKISAVAAPARWGEQRAHSYPFPWAGFLEKLLFQSVEITPVRNSKFGSPRLSFFHFLLQDQPYPKPSEQQKKMSPILPEAGSNYQPLMEWREDAKILSSCRHMGVNLKSVTNFSGMVHMPEGPQW